MLQTRIKEAKTELRKMLNTWSASEIVEWVHELTDDKEMDALRGTMAYLSTVGGGILIKNPSLAELQTIEQTLSSLYPNMNQSQHLINF